MIDHVSVTPSRRRAGWLALILCILAVDMAAPAVSPEPAPPAERPVELFAPGGSVERGDPGDPTVIRRRVVRTASGPLLEAERGQRLRAHLFDDVSPELHVRSVRRREPGRATVVATVVGGSGGSAVFVVDDAMIVGDVRDPVLGTYRVRGTGGGEHVISQIDERRFPPCFVQTVDREADPPASGVPGDGNCDDGSVIDVLVLYTWVARSAAGGTAAIRAEIAVAIEQTNTAYAGSGITTQLNLVHVAETSYSESGSFLDHLARLRTFGDGHMDEAHTLRDEHRADMVALLVNDPGACGMAYVMRNLTPLWESWCFSVTNWTCAVSNLTFAHELGHNQGCCHAPGDGGGCEQGGLFDYSWGHRFGPNGQYWRTVMAYAPGFRVPRFSNSDILYGGYPTGIADERENARTINETAFTVANFRCSLGLCPADVNGDGEVNVQDLLMLLAAWGPYAPCPPHDPADINRDCRVDVQDLLELLAAWGACP